MMPLPAIRARRVDASVVPSGPQVAVAGPRYAGHFPDGSVAVGGVLGPELTRGAGIVRLVPRLADLVGPGGSLTFASAPP